MPWTTPKTDWDTNPTNPLPSDFNRIEGNIDFLSTDIETKKGLIVDALNSVGIAALIADTHVQLASKITSTKKTGVSITPGTANQAIPKGIYDTGGGNVLGDPDLISANIKAGINIFGVAGNSNVVDTSGGDATAAQILSGKKAYVDGALVTGTIPSKGAATITPGTANQTIAAGQYLSGIQTIAGDTDLVAGNIKSGINIFNVLGAYLGAGIKRIEKIWENHGSNLTSNVSITLSTACDLANTFLILIPSYITTSSGVIITLTNATTVDLSVVLNRLPYDAELFLVEFNPGVIKSKQTIARTQTSSSTLQSFTISSVDPTKVLCIPLRTYNSSGGVFASVMGHAYNADTLYTYGSSGSLQVIEFY